MGTGRRPEGIVAAGWLPLAFVLSSCGTTTPAEGVEATSSDADDAATDADSSTAADPWNPMQECNPGFDAGLASGTILWTQ